MVNQYTLFFPFPLLKAHYYYMPLFIYQTIYHYRFFFKWILADHMLEAFLYKKLLRGEGDWPCNKVKHHRGALGCCISLSHFSDVWKTRCVLLTQSRGVKKILCPRNTPGSSAQNTEILALQRRLGRQHETQTLPGPAPNELSPG